MNELCPSKQNFTSRKKSVFLVTFLFLSFGSAVFAQGDLLIFPKRLVFENNRDRVQTLNLHNNGRDTATYRLSYIENRMNETGGFEQLEKPDAGQKFASPFLRFYPRSITLAPGETQVVKVQLTKTSDLQPGEYRSHLYFRAAPKTEAREQTKKAAPVEGLSISITPVYGISIANIIRVGEPKVQVKINDLALEHSEEENPVLLMHFNRSGNMSSYGDITVLHISPGGIETIVGEVKGVAVYTPGNVRKARLELKTVEGIDYKSGSLKVIYNPQGNGKNIYDQAILEL